MEKTRHLRMEELLALRDGEGSVFALTHVEECAGCRGELERLYQVRARLRALPTVVPPRDLWPLVAGTVTRRRRRKRIGLGGTGLAAAAVFAGLVMARGPAASEFVAEPQDVWVSEVSSEDLGPIIDRSRELESLLRTFRPQYRVYDARTALAVSVLEDRIVLLDRMLDEGQAIGADREILVGLWGERVQTLETLVGLQAVQEDRVWW